MKAGRKLKRAHGNLDLAIRPPLRAFAADHYPRVAAKWLANKRSKTPKSRLHDGIRRRPQRKSPPRGQGYLMYV